MVLKRSMLSKKFRLFNYTGFSVSRMVLNRNSNFHNFLQDLYNYQLNQLTNDTFWLQEAARLQREQTWTPATMSPAPGSSSSRESSLDPTSCVVHTASASVLRYLLNGNWHVLVVHSFLKQCLHDLHFLKTRYFSPNLFKLAPADISWSPLFS